MNRRWLAWALVPALATAAHAWQAEGAPKPKKKPDFPKFEEVAKDYKKVVSTADGAPSLYTIWVRKKDNQMLAELPKSYASQKHFFALTVAGGEYPRHTASVPPRSSNTRVVGYSSTP